jgi:hypothetical protein
MTFSTSRMNTFAAAASHAMPAISTNWSRSNGRSMPTVHDSVPLTISITTRTGSTSSTSMNGTATETIGSTATGKRDWKTRWRLTISDAVACCTPAANQLHAISPLNTKTGKWSIPRSRIVEKTNTSTASCASCRTTGHAQPRSVNRCIDATSRRARWTTTSTK